MPQHDMVLDDAPGVNFRSDMNAALLALASNNSGATAPAVTYAYMWWPDTANGVLKQRNAANTAWIVRAPLAETLVVARAANTALGVGDCGRTIIASGTWTQTFAAAAALGDGWFVECRNNGTGVITLDPNGSETIDGAITIQLAPGEDCCIYCNGSAFYTVGRTASALQNQAATAFTSTGTAPSFTLAPVPALTAYAANQRFRIKFNAAGNGADTLNVSALGAKSLKQYDSAGNKIAPVIVAGQLADVEYDGVDFVILDPLPAASQPGFRNKIINGKMDIAQRGTSFAAIAAGAYSADRWGFGNTSAAVLTASQQADGPNYDFPNSLRFAVTTADAAIAAGDQSTVGQVIEGYNVRDLVGRSFTLSFWVRSSKTGTHCVSFRNSTPDRSYVAEYTINVANTWEFKTVTVAGGLPTAGTWDWANGAGLRVSWALAAGSTYQAAAGAWQAGNFLVTANQVNCLDTVGNIFAITGVQLEIGATATPLEHRAYGLELSLCERFFEAILNADRCATGTGAYSYTWRFRQQKRASPTIVSSGVNQSGLSVDGVALWTNTTGGIPPSTNASAEIAYV